MSPAIERYATTFLGPDLRMGHVHLWCADKGYDTGWHRDIGTGNQDDDAEREMALYHPADDGFAVAIGPR